MCWVFFGGGELNASYTGLHGTDVSEDTHTRTHTRTEDMCPLWPLRRQVVAIGVTAL